eukprot:5876863-Prymnesium_polylepis.1
MIIGMAIRFITPIELPSSFTVTAAPAAAASRGPGGGGERGKGGEGGNGGAGNSVVVLAVPMVGVETTATPRSFDAIVAFGSSAERSAASELLSDSLSVSRKTVRITLALSTVMFTRETGRATSDANVAASWALTDSS